MSDFPPAWFILAEPSRVLARTDARPIPWLWLAGFALSLLLPLVTLIFLSHGPWSWRVALIWTLPVGLLIAADFYSPPLTRSPPAGRSSVPFDAVLGLLFVAHLTNVVALCLFARATEWGSLPQAAESLVNLLAARVLCGTTACCSGVAPAHELIHRRSRWAVLAGRLMLITVGYDHFAVAHLRFHHRRARREADPSIARPSEDYPAFLRRTVPAQFALAWRAGRMETLKGLTMELALALAVAWFAGWVALVMLLVQGVVAVRLLEAVNYFQHFGLNEAETRRSVTWTCDSALSYFLFLGLSRHAAHHRRVGTPYPHLGYRADGPRLPCGYLGAALWVKNASRSYAAHASGDLTRWRQGQG